MSKLIKKLIAAGVVFSPVALLANDISTFAVESGAVDGGVLEIQQAKDGDPINGMLRKFLNSPNSSGAMGRRSSSQDTQWVTVNISVEGSADEVAANLRELGMQSLSVTDYLISGRIRVADLTLLRSVKGVRDVRQSVIYTRAGAATTQGDVAQQSDVARRNFALTGKGIRVGIMSDSFNCHDEGTAAQKDIDAGELPLKTIVVKDPDECTGKLDEGRALAQVVHDIAPDAEIIFHTAGGMGTAGLAETIQKLAEDYQADVIVDDFAVLDEPFFQDSVISQAIENVSQSGVAYITAAGNAGSNSYTSPFRPTIDPTSNALFNTKLHDFDSSEDSTNVFQRITIPKGEGILLAMQWDEPFYSVSGFPGSQSDLDIHLLDKSKTKILASANAANIGADPYEVLQFLNEENSTTTEFNLIISLKSGKSPNFIKYMVPIKFGGTIDHKLDSHYNNGSTIVGHSNAEAAISVGATAYYETPPYGLYKPTVEEFSSRGGTPLFFNADGDRFLEGAKFRVKPDVTAPNNVNTTFFKGSEALDRENDGFPNFLGTSASAPHIAGVVALMLESNPNLEPWKIRRILQTTATNVVQDEADTGFDLASGFGLVNALTAIEKISDIAEIKEPPAELPKADDYSFDTTPRTELVVPVARSSTSGSISMFSIVLLFLTFLAMFSIRRQIKVKENR